MMRVSSVLAAVALGGCFATVGPEGQTTGGEAALTLSFPAAPPLVTVQPGVSVVRDWDAEVFYSSGYYWTRSNRYWYRASDHRGRWARVEERSVPVAIARSPPGRYRHYRGEEYRQGDHHHTHDGRDGRDGPVDRR